MSAYDDLILGNANCVAYWKLDGAITDSKGTNDLSGGTAGTYVTGPFGFDRAMLFDGATQSISSASAIDLTGTQKATIMMWWFPTVYDEANSEILVEFSTNGDTTAGGFIVVTNGSTAGDPLRVGAIGNVGSNQKLYTNTVLKWSEKKYNHLAFVIDFSQATPANEVFLYRNGALATHTSTAGSSNNTGNLGNHTLFVAARNNASVFANHTFAKIALFNTALTSDQIATIYQYAPKGGKQLRQTEVYTRKSLSKFFRGDSSLIHAYPLADSGGDEVGKDSIEVDRFRENSAYFDSFNVGEYLEKGGPSSTVVAFVKYDGSSDYELRSFRGNDETVLNDVYVRELMIFNTNVSESKIEEFERWARGTNRMAY